MKRVSSPWPGGRECTNPCAYVDNTPSGGSASRGSVNVGA